MRFDRIEFFLGTYDLLQNVTSVGSPDEWFGILVVSEHEELNPPSDKKALSLNSSHHSTSDPVIDHHPGIFMLQVVAMHQEGFIPGEVMRKINRDALTSRPPNPLFIKLHFEFELAP